MDRTTAFRAIHAPESFAEQERARRRLAFDELLRLQLEVVMRRHVLERDARGIRHVVAPSAPTPDLVDAFVAQLPFRLDRRPSGAPWPRSAPTWRGRCPCIGCCRVTWGRARPWWRCARCWWPSKAGHQGALMAPTEVLAEQHFLGVRELLANLVVPDPERLGGSRPLAVSLLTNRTPAGERAKLHEGLRAGSVDVVVGTHALLTDEVRFSSLGVVVIDEQHRFGVEQRAALAGQGPGAARRGGCRSRPARDDGDSHPPHGRHGGLRRPRRDRARRASRRTLSRSNAVGAEPRRRERRLDTRARRGGGGPSRLRGVPPGRGFRARPGDLRHRGAGPPRVHGPVGPAHRAPARPAEGGREGGGHGSLPAGRDRGPGGDDGDRGGGRRARGDGHGRRGRRSIRDRPAPPAAGPGGAFGPAFVVLSARRGLVPRGGPAPRGPREAPPTGSSWPRSTSSCGARAPSWARARRAAAT